MKAYLPMIFVLLTLGSGCTQEPVHIAIGVGTFVDRLKEHGVDGTLEMAPPINEDMEYVANYRIAVYTSTRILSILKCKDVEKAKYHFQESLKNPRLTGQARNGRYIFVATFFPPDETAVQRIKELFESHEFE